MEASFPCQKVLDGNGPSKAMSKMRGNKFISGNELFSSTLDWNKQDTYTIDKVLQIVQNLLVTL